MSTAITIRPLEWKFISTDFWESKVLGIMFLVYREEDGWIATSVEDCDAANGEWGETNMIGSYKTEQQAKDACQVNFNQSVYKFVTVHDIQPPASNA